MCEFSRRLIAWLDGELPVDEALEVELHLDTCMGCQHELRVYERLSGALGAYCDATLESSARRSELRWKPAALGVGAVAVVLALVLAPHARRTQPLTNAASATALSPTTRVAVEAPSLALNSVILGPPRRARSGFRTPENLSSISQEHKRDSLAKSTPRFTASVLRERNDDALNVRAAHTAAGWQPAEPAIQITIPAEAVLPPGTVPEGVSFVAEVSIAPDGSAHQIFLQP